MAHIERGFEPTPTTGSDEVRDGNQPRIALVHERFTEVAGSEHVVKQLSVAWPQASVHSSIARSSGVPHGIPQIQTTWLDSCYRTMGQRTYAPLMPLMPSAFRGMDLTDVDVVVASHHAFATQVVFATDAPVVAYVHSPARWAWDPSLRAGEGGAVVGAAGLAALSRVARRGEIAAAHRLSTIVANSTAVAERIRERWRRDAVVVHPPVDTDRYTVDPSVETEDFFLLAGRLVPYKRPDLAVLAAKQAGVRLVVAGDGRAMGACRKLAGPETTFLGRVSDQQLLDLYRRARAVLMPGQEDFGIVPVESMCTGTPVIALGLGGAIDTVVPNVTGLHIAPGSDQEVVDGLAAAMRDFDPADFDTDVIREWAEGFSAQVFRTKMREVVDGVLESAAAPARRLA